MSPHLGFAAKLTGLSPGVGLVSALLGPGFPWSLGYFPPGKLSGSHMPVSTPGAVDYGQENWKAFSLLNYRDEAHVQLNPRRAGAGMVSHSTPFPPPALFLWDAAGMRCPQCSYPMNPQLS